MPYRELEARTGLLGKLGVKLPGPVIEVGGSVIVEEGLDDASSDGFQAVAVYLVVTVLELNIYWAIK